jgi:hypothetical protein
MSKTLTETVNRPAGKSLARYKKADLAFPQEKSLSVNLRLKEPKRCLGFQPDLFVRLPRVSSSTSDCDAESDSESCRADRTSHQRLNCQ